MIYFLTSSPSVCVDGPINPANGFLDRLREALGNNPLHALFVTTYPDDIPWSEHCSGCMRQAFEDVGFRFASYVLLDRRTAPQVRKLLKQCDFLILGGGHLPSQNTFLHELGMPELIKKFKGVVMGISAGTMNSARMAYALPEESGEPGDEDFARLRPGLGLTEWRILPHYYHYKDLLVDGLRMYDDIAIPDSRKLNIPFFFFPDGTYLLGENGTETIHGEFLMLKDGVVRRVAEDGQQTRLPLA